VRIDTTGEQPTAAPAESSPRATISLTEFLADESRTSDAWNCLPSPWMRLEIDLAVADLPKPHFPIHATEQNRSVSDRQSPRRRLAP
jgi:hypothetical protein